MTVDLATPVSRTRARLVALGRRDLGAAMDLAVPFVLAHPAQAGVLVDLGGIASHSEPDWRTFRAGLRVLFASVEP